MSSLGSAARQKRQFHGKSRNGCQNCKKRHIKCDEQGPPCANCVARKFDCAYTAAAIGWVQTINGTSPSRLSETVSTTASTPISSTFDTAWPSANDPIPAALRRSIELDLMHQWTSSTWKSFCVMDEDCSFFLDALPRLALDNHDFLLDGLLAVAALDIVACSSRPDKAALRQVALELCSRSSVSYREGLARITEENCLPYVVYSLFTVVINLVLPRQIPAALGRTVSSMDSIKTLFELARGARLVASLYGEELDKKYVSTGLVRRALQNNASTPVEGEAKQIIGRLEAINDQLHAQTSEDSLEANISRPIHDMYRSVIGLLRIFHVEDQKGSIEGLCLAAFNQVGENFKLALNESEPFALLLLMHWAVLMHRHNKKFWWTRLVGKDLVDEIMPFIQQSELVCLPTVVKHLNWIQSESSLYM